MEYDELGFSPHSNSSVSTKMLILEVFSDITQSWGVLALPTVNMPWGASGLYLTLSKFPLAFTYNTAWGQPVNQGLQSLPPHHWIQ